MGIFLQEGFVHEGGLGAGICMGVLYGDFLHRVFFCIGGDAWRGKGVPRHTNFLEVIRPQRGYILLVLI